MNCIFCQCVEEILGYLKSCFSREPTMATVCVQQVSMFTSVGFFFDCVCGSRFSSSTEQCAATGVTPHRVRLVPADRAIKGVGFPVRWFHTYLYTHMVIC